MTKLEATIRNSGNKGEFEFSKPLTINHQGMPLKLVWFGWEKLKRDVTYICGWKVTYIGSDKKYHQVYANWDGSTLCCGQDFFNAFKKAILKHLGNVDIVFGSPGSKILTYSEVA